jgi:3-hydroxyisobutyrate dehydrogenase
MGYPMAINLRSKLGSQHTLLICDVNKDALARFQEVTSGQGPVKVVENGFEAVKESVSPRRPSLPN